MASTTLELLSSSEVCEEAGITFRQLDYWIREGYFVPAVEAKGSGFRRRFTKAQVRALRLAARLMADGMACHTLGPLLANAERIPEDGWDRPVVITREGEILDALQAFDEGIASVVWLVDLRQIVKDEPMTVERDLIERLVASEPVSWSTEGLDDACMFCGAVPDFEIHCQTDPKWPGSSHRHTIHETSCTWIAGLRFLERPLPHGHLVKS